MSQAIDPVRNPAAYQASLLGALGCDDPADVQATMPSALRQLIAEAGENLRRPPPDGGWSVLELLGHIVDAELVSSARYRWILAEDQPDIVGYDQDAWVAGLRHGLDDPAELLALFDALRAANLALWWRSDDAARSRIGLHRERGPESYELTFRLLAGHDRVHLRQARGVLAFLRGTTER